MSARNCTLILILLVLNSFFGCSSGARNPSNPPDVSKSSDIAGSEWNLSGMWTADINLDSKTVEITPTRDASAHMLITSLLPAPEIVINSLDPVTQTADVDFTITNPYAINGYDLRLIIYTDSAGHKLMNFDSWTDLFDIAGGLPINPFKAFAKEEVYRRFAGMTSHTENLIVKLPGWNASVRFAIETSFPGNCTEPYEMNSFGQGEIFDLAGSSTRMGIDVFDWQDNISAVYLYCPAITGVTLLPFDVVSDETWSTIVVNETGADSGDYAGYLLAYSSDAGSQALYTEVSIRISHEHQPNDPQIIGECDIWSGMGVEIYGNYAYVADGNKGLKVISIGNPELPEVVGALEFGGLITDVAVDVFHVFLTDGTNGNLYEVDHQIPEGPELVDTYHTAGIATGVSLDWPYAYVANGYTRTLIFDVSVEDTLDYLAAVPQNDWSNHAIGRDAWMYVADYESGVQVINVEEKDNPLFITELDTYCAQGLELAGSYLYVADSLSGVTVIDVSDPYAASIVTTVETIDNAIKLDSMGNFLYVADGHGGLVILDITEPTAPYIFSDLDLGGNCTDVTVYDRYAYAVTGAGKFKVIQLW
jgi:hypothetical protein